MAANTFLLLLLLPAKVRLAAAAANCDIAWEDITAN
jgi:hypothetical protein